MGFLHEFMVEGGLPKKNQRFECSYLPEGIVEENKDIHAKKKHEMIPKFPAQNHRIQS